MYQLPETKRAKMDDDPQFNLDVVREFMILRNFKVSNRELVSHFKPFLTHPERREINREKFRDYVNTLSTVKQDDKGEKILVLKKKYRKSAAASTEGASAEKKHEKKREKQASPSPADSAQAGAMASLAEPQTDSAAECGASAAEDSFTSAGSSMTAETEPSPDREVNPSQARRQEELRPPSVILTKPSTSSDDVDGAGASRPAEDEADVTSPGEKGLAEDDVFNKSDNSTGEPSDDFEFKPVPLPTSMSVKERAKHLNKIESDSNLQNVKMRKHGDKKDDDSSSVSSGGYVPMDETDREWMITVATADYHPIHRLLNMKPELAKRRDFITSALHWAAKHGKSEVIKLLCATPGINVNARSGYTPLHMAAMHGHEDIIELLVHGYSADPNLRDYSGKKAKQYLRNSASSRTHQILQARRPSSIIVNGNQPFKRVGSYSAKIHKSGFFGIHGGSAVRSSWAAGTGSDAGSDKDRASPSPSLSPSPSPRSSPLPSPRSRRKGSKPPRPPPPQRPPRPPPRRRRDAPCNQCGPSPLVTADTGKPAAHSDDNQVKPPGAAQPLSPGAAQAQPPGAVESLPPGAAKSQNTGAAQPHNTEAAQSQNTGDIQPIPPGAAQPPPPEAIQQVPSGVSNLSSGFVESEAQVNGHPEVEESNTKNRGHTVGRFSSITEEEPEGEENTAVPYESSDHRGQEDGDLDEEIYHSRVLELTQSPGGMARRAMDEGVPGSDPSGGPHGYRDPAEVHEPRYVYLPHQGESSDYSRDEFQAELTDRLQERPFTHLPQTQEEEEGEGDGGYCAISFMDRLLGSSSTDPEDPGEEPTHRSYAPQEDIQEEDEEDEWAQNLRYQSAFLQSVGFFQKPDQDEFDGQDQPYDSDQNYGAHRPEQSYNYPDGSNVRDREYEGTTYEGSAYEGSAYEGSAYEGSVYEGREYGATHEEDVDLRNSPYYMAPFAMYQEDPPEAMVAPPRRRRSKPQEQPEPEDSPLPTAPPRRRRSQRDAASSPQQLSGSRDMDLMPPPHGGAPSRKKKSRKDEDKENMNRLPRPHSEPTNLTRAVSNPEVSEQPHMTPAPVTSPFV